MLHIVINIAYGLAVFAAFIAFVLLFAVMTNKYEDNAIQQRKNILDEDFRVTHIDEKDNN